MAPRGLDPKMILVLRDVVERDFSKMSTQLKLVLLIEIRRRLLSLTLVQLIKIRI